MSSGGHSVPDGGSGAEADAPADGWEFGELRAAAEDRSGRSRWQARVERPRCPEDAGVRWEGRGVPMNPE